MRSLAAILELPGKPGNGVKWLLSNSNMAAELTFGTYFLDLLFQNKSILEDVGGFNSLLIGQWEALLLLRYVINEVTSYPQIFRQVNTASDDYILIKEWWKQFTGFNFHVTLPLTINLKL